MTNSKISPNADARIALLTRKEVSHHLRISERTVEEQTKRWERNLSGAEGTQPSSPQLGLRPTRVTSKMVLYDLRDVGEYLANARLEQEGKTPIRLVGVEP